MKESRLTTLAKLAMFCATLIWGSSFIIVKEVVNTVPTYCLLAIRFLVAAALLAIVFFKHFKKFDLKYVWQGAVLGLMMFLAYTLQTFGITETTPGKNAFLTAVYCVIVPFLFWAVDKKRPDRYNIIAALLCISGIGLVSLKGGFAIGIGDSLTLCGGFFYAAHIIAVAKFSKGRDTILLTVFQFTFSGILSLIMTLLTENRAGIVSNTQLVWSIGYLAVLCTAVALLMQNFGQKYTHPAAASIILSLESVFGVAFSVALYGEEVTPKIAVGFILIFMSVIISETKLSFLKKKKQIA